MRRSLPPPSQLVHSVRSEGISAPNIFYVRRRQLQRCHVPKRFGAPCAEPATATRSSIVNCSIGVSTKQIWVNRSCHIGKPAKQRTLPRRSANTNSTSGSDSRPPNLRCVSGISSHLSTAAGSAGTVFRASLAKARAARTRAWARAPSART